MGRRTKLVALGVWAAMVVISVACQHIMPAGMPSVTTCPGYLCEGFMSPDLPGAEVMVCARDSKWIPSFLDFLGLGKVAAPAPAARAAASAEGTPPSRGPAGARWVSVGPVGLDGAPLDAGPDAKAGP